MRDLAYPFLLMAVVGIALYVYGLSLEIRAARKEIKDLFEFRYRITGEIRSITKATGLSYRDGTPGGYYKNGGKR